MFIYEVVQSFLCTKFSTPQMLPPKFQPPLPTFSLSTLSPAKPDPHSPSPPIEYILFLPCWEILYSPCLANHSFLPNLSRSSDHSLIIIYLTGKLVISPYK